jgi:hypothetical protein
MPRRSLAVLGWLAAVVVATLAGVGAIRLVGDSIAGTPGGVRSQAEVERDLAAAVARRSPTPAPVSPTPSTGPTPSGTASPAPEANRKSFRITGGTVVAVCEGGLVSIVSWWAADGFAMRDLDPGPDDEAEIRFEGSRGRSEIKLGCQAGHPVQTGHDD